MAEKGRVRDLTKGKKSHGNVSLESDFVLDESCEIDEGLVLKRLMTSDENDSPTHENEKTEGYLDGLKLMCGFNGIADSKGRLQFATVGTIRGLGYTEKEILRKPFWQAGWFAQSPKSQKDVKDCLLETLKGKCHRCQVNAFSKEGICIPVSFNMTPLNGQEGGIVSIVAEAEPSTKKASDLSVLLDGIPEIIIETDSTAMITYINDMCRNSLGWESTDIIGTHLLTHIHQDDTAVISQSIARDEAGESFAEQKVRIKGGDGSYRAVVVTPISLPQRGRTYFVCMGTTRVLRAFEASSEDRFQLLFETIPDPAFIASTQGTMAQVNQAFCDRTGYSREDIIGIPLLSPSVEVELIPQEDVPRILDIFMKRLAGEEVPTHVIRVRTKDGRYVMAELNATAIVENGEIVGELGIARDVTDRIHAEEELKQSEERFRTLIENASDAVAVVRVDGIIIYESPSVERLLGYTPEELIGTQAFDLINPEDLHSIMPIYEEYKNIHGAAATREIRIRTKDGSWLWCEIVGQNLLDHPQIQGLVINYRDISDRIKAEEEIRASEQRYRELYNLSPDVIITMDLMGTLTSASPSVEVLTGYTYEEFEGRSLAEVMPLDEPEDLTAATKFFEAAMQGQEMTDLEVRIKHKDGTYRWLNCRTRQLKQEDVPFGLLVIARDITERKEADEELRRSGEKLQDTVEKLRLSQEELSTPVVQIWDRVLALPLIGILDSPRAQRVMEVLLARVVETQSEMVILDVTGINSMDTEVTNNLVRTIQSTSLLGARCVVTGIKPDVAQSMSQLGLDIGKLVTKRDLQDGLRYALQMMGYDLKSGRRASDQ